MQISRLVFLALIGMSVYDTDAQAIQLSSQISDFNGADEDEIMDKVFSKYS